MNHEDTPQVDDTSPEHHQHDQEEKKAHSDAHPDRLSPRLQELIALTKTQIDPERRLETVIAFMEQVLTQTGATQFKDFWDARKLCLDIFKENINPTSRTTFWAKYSELCRLARELKDILNEQSAFAAEQIEIAVVSLEKELTDFSALLASMPAVDFGVPCHTIEEHYHEYDLRQRELNLLNTYAIRTNTLRKELMKTEMRIRQKNQFFERLSKLGDVIFPRRKTLIQEVSVLFANDVEHFLDNAFRKEMKTPQLFDLREEIKALQSIAKVLTLNTEAFSVTRKKLSECWDGIKNVVKERRKVFAEQKTVNKQHRDQFIEQLEAIKVSAQSGEITAADADNRLEGVSQEMRNTSLGRQEVRELREKIQELRKMFASQVSLQEAAKQQEAQKREEELLARFEKLKDDLQALINRSADLSLEQFSTESEKIIREVVEAKLNRTLKQQIERFERQIRDIIEEKKDQQLLQLSDDEREAINQLKEILKERKSRRQEIKAKINDWRKASGGSGLDFTQAMRFNELIEGEKERLEKIESGIYDIEKEIVRLQRQAKSDKVDA